MQAGDGRNWRITDWLRCGVWHACTMQFLKHGICLVTRGRLTFALLQNDLATATLGSTYSHCRAVPGCTTAIWHVEGSGFGEHACYRRKACHMHQSCLPSDSPKKTHSSTCLAYCDGWHLAAGCARNEGWRPAEAHCASKLGELLIAHRSQCYNVSTGLCSSTLAFVSCVP